MDRPTKKKNTWSAFTRYESRRTSLSDYSPPEGHDPVPLKPKQVSSFKQAPFDLHENHPRREHLNERGETGTKSQSSNALSKNVINIEDSEISPIPKSRHPAAVRSAQSQYPSASLRNFGTRLLDGLEESQRVESQVDCDARLVRRERPGKPSPTNRSSLLSKIDNPTASSHQRDNSQRQKHIALGTYDDLGDLDTDAEETVPTLQKSDRTNSSVSINQSTNNRSSLQATSQSKGIGKPSFSAKPNDGRQDGNSPNDSQSDHSVQSWRDMNDQIAASRERPPPLKTKTQRSIDRTDSSEDELALQHIQPKTIIQSRLNNGQARVSNTGKTEGTLLQPLKVVKQDSGTEKYRIISIFSETHYWLRPQPLGNWLLHQDHCNGVLTIFNENGDPIHELILKPQIIQKVQRNSDSEKLVINKHKDVRSNGSTKLFLELYTADDAWQICNKLKEHDSTISLVTLEESQLDQTFMHNRKLVDSMHPKGFQPQIMSKMRNVEAQALHAAATQRQERGQKGIKQEGIFADGCRKGERKNEHDSFAIGKRKIREEDVEPQAKKESLGGRLKPPPPNTSDDRSLLSVEDSPSIDPDSFHGNRIRSSSRLADREPALRKLSNRRSPSLERWTEVHQNWAQAWKSPIVYPRHQGEKRSKTMVEKKDIERLDDGQFFNDNLINFYLCWLQHHLEEENPNLAQRTYFHNTFFYKSLTKTAKGKRGINYEAVQRWTSKVDLLSFDYIIVPINENTHWYVAIICNAPNLQGLQPEVVPGLQSPQQRDGSEDLSESVDMVMLPPPAPQSSQTGRVMRSNKLTGFEVPGVDALMEEVSFKQTASYAKDDKSNAVWPKDHIDLEKQNPSTDLCDESAGIQAASDLQISQNVKSSLARNGKEKSHADRKFDPSQPRIITLDSLGLKHSPTCTNLKNYLIAEIKAKKRIDIPPPGSLGMTAVNIPQQANYFDCGAFLLIYIEQFLKRPSEFIYDIMQAQDLQIEFQSAAFMRDHIRQILLKLQEEQVDEAKGLAQEEFNNKQFPHAKNELHRPQKASDHPQTVAATDQTHSESRFFPDELSQDQHTIERSAVDTAAGYRQPNGIEGTSRDVLDVDETSYVSPVSDSKYNPLISSPIRAFRKEKRQGQPRSSISRNTSCLDSMERLDTPEKIHNGGTILPSRDTTPVKRQRPSRISVEMVVDGFQDSSPAKSTSRISAGATNDDLVVVVDS